MAAGGLASFVLVLGVSFATAAIALFLAARIVRAQIGRDAAAAELDGAGSQIAFLFEDERLLDATPAARDLLRGSAVRGNDWERLAALLRSRFSGLEQALERLAEDGEVEVFANHGPRDRIRAEWRRGLARVALIEAEPAPGDARVAAERQALAVQEAELAMLRGILRTGPVAIWRQARGGEVVWANEAYFALVTEVHGSGPPLTWPPPALFPLAGPVALAAGSPGAPVRAALRRGDGSAERWFECHSYPAGNEVLHFALPADALVRTEETLHEFVQTLSKTFADLPVGLAVFDKARRLALFNPALTDLTSLDAGFLLGRPSLSAFLDQLREKRRMPEPRDYRSWRQKMTEFESAAADGYVQEHWTLPTGQTYRVTGRPHPDGAVAFLFEDISSEISLTRRFRSEIELSQTVLDSFDEAIAVFSAAGVLTMANAAYVRLSDSDPDRTLAEIGILDATRTWQQATLPNPIWGDVRDFLADRGERADWSGQARMRDGRALWCRFQPLPGGATLIGFTAGEPPESEVADGGDAAFAASVPQTAGGGPAA